MLISPLMGPIVGVGYGAGVKDLQLIRQSLRNLGVFVAISLLTATLYFLLTRSPHAQSELLSRTSPTLWDVLIAFFGGAVGMIRERRRYNSSLRSPRCPRYRLDAAAMHRRLRYIYRQPAVFWRRVLPVHHQQRLHRLCQPARGQVIALAGTRRNRRHDPPTYPPRHWLHRHCHRRTKRLPRLRLGRTESIRRKSNAHRPEHRQG
ncbi:MAG: DUF389 domain-containing protein [Betaproteobacteria bacterium]|nr:DUF389 domain-containing protein [Betaproteobacteria bacterium]